jgi:signal transduction histidine kinase
MSKVEGWSDSRLVRPSQPEPVASFASDAVLAEPRSLRFEIIVFLLLVATFAAVLFKGAIVERAMAVNGDNISHYTRYWFADESAGGRSTASGSATDPMRWSCDLKAGFAYPFCGSGIIFDVARNGTGHDLSKYGTVLLDLDYRGPSRHLKISFKNARHAGSDKIEKPSFIEFPVVMGRNHVELSLAGAAVEQWWALQHKELRDAATPQFDNVVAIEIQTGDGAPGHHQFVLRQIEFRGSAVSVENWYLILLGIWVGIAALYLAFRMIGIKRGYRVRQQVLLAESRLLQDARDAAESASQAKSRFLAHMSHELRTPLNAILGYAQILNATSQNERQLTAARTIKQSGEHLLSLISDILDLSRIEADRFELTPRPIDLRQMVRDVADMIAVRAQEKDVAFQWAIAPDVPRGVIVDDKCLRQVLINLLGNAVKFTDRGEVRLQVAALGTGGGDVSLRFDVRDTGAGIDAGKFQTIFQPFEQVGDAANRAGGTGLGLSISRRIVELMGGSLQVESTVGVGSRFWLEVTLPLADNSALPPAFADEDGGSIALRRPRDSFEAVPDGARMDQLHDLAMAGNMRAIRAEAESLLKAEPQVRAFAEELLLLARNYQSQAILELIEKHKSESVAV